MNSLSVRVPFLRKKSNSHLSSTSIPPSLSQQPNLTVRNITNTVLELVSVEYFDPHQNNAAGLGAFQLQNITKTFANVTANVTNSVGLTNSTTRASVPEISPTAQAFEKRDTNIRVDPFAVVDTNLPARIKVVDERLRLTFQVEGGGGTQHQMYCPVPTTTPESQALKVIGDEHNNTHRFTGIYITSYAHVTLYSSSALDRWMSRLPDHLPLGALSIPGTHNSPTCHLAPPSVRCQAVSPQVQLRNGVRFFDIRVQVPEPFNRESDKLILVHSVFPVSLSGTRYFRDLYSSTLHFLEQNPSETLIMSIKREGSGKGTDEQLFQILKRHYIDNSVGEKWFVGPRVPNLGQVRGKIVLVRRFNVPPEFLQHQSHGNDNDDNNDHHEKEDNKEEGWAIDASSWEDNTPNSFNPSQTLCVQDFYQVMENSTIDQKIKYAREHLERSGTCRFPSSSFSSSAPPSPPKQQQAQQNLSKRDNYPLYINFLSASNFWKLGTWPEKIAGRVNPAIVEFLCREHMLFSPSLSLSGADDISSSTSAADKFGGDDGDMMGRTETKVKTWQVKDGDWSTGVVVCDWVGLDGDWDLVRCIVGMNAKLIS